MITMENVSLKDVDRIIDLYSQMCGGDSEQLKRRSKTILGRLRKGDTYDGYRCGSYWDRHSKLEFDIDRDTKQITATFNPNFDPRERRENNPAWIAANEAREAFAVKVSTLEHEDD